MSQMKRPILMSHFNVTDEKTYFNVTLLCHKIVAKIVYIVHVSLWVIADGPVQHGEK